MYVKPSLIERFIMTDQKPYTFKNGVFSFDVDEKECGVLGTQTVPEIGGLSSFVKVHKAPKIAFTEEEE